MWQSCASLLTLSSAENLNLLSGVFFFFFENNNVYSYCYYSFLASTYVGHALDTGADANVDEAGLDCGSDVGHCLQTGRALAVERGQRGGLGEAGVEGGHAGHGCAATGGLHVADLDVLHEALGQVDLVDHGLEHGREQILGHRVLERTALGLGDGSAHGAHNNDVVIALGLVCRLDLGGGRRGDRRCGCPDE